MSLVRIAQQVRPWEGQLYRHGPLALKNEVHRLITLCIHSGVEAGNAQSSAERGENKDEPDAYAGLFFLGYN